MTTDPERNNFGAPLCGGHRQNGDRCRAASVAGSNPPRCPRHTGKTLARAKAEGAIRLELAQWSPGALDLVDPTDQFLTLITQSAKRCADYAKLLAADFMDHGVAALIGVAWTQTEDGGQRQSGEYIRGLTRLEQEERRFCADLCAKAIAAGIEERRVRLAEKQFDLMDRVLRAVLLELGHDPDAPDIRRVVSRQILQLTG